MAQLLQFSQKAIIERGKQVLVVKNPPNAERNPSMIDFPGGRMQFGETIDSHMIREVFEETGVKVRPLDLVDILTWTIKMGDKSRRELLENDLQVVAVVRRCKYISGKVTLVNNVDDEKLAKVYWVEPSKLLSDRNFDSKLVPALKKYLRLKQ